MVSAVPPLGSRPLAPSAKVEPADDEANQQPTLSHRLSIADGDDEFDSDFMNVRFRAFTPPFDAPHSSGPKKLAVVGSLPQLGDWHLDGSVPLRVVRTDGEWGVMVVEETIDSFLSFSAFAFSSLSTRLALTFDRFSLSLADQHVLFCTGDNLVWESDPVAIPRAR